MESCRIPANLLSEEYELSRFMRETMSSAAVNKDRTKFDAFCLKLVELPYKKRFPFAFNFFESINGFPMIEPKSMKSSIEALRFKNLGNIAFRAGNFIEALKLYTKSVAVAPVGSSDLAVAFGNRSAALFELQRYEGCMVDVNRALNENNCPETSRPKLVNRKEKCRSKLIELHAVEIDYQKSMEKLSVRNERRETKVDCPIDEDALDLDYSGKFPLPETNFKNESISNASEKIKITVNSQFGRHIVAVEDIEIGEFIGVEKPYASVLFKTCQYSHCANCFVRCEALIPCPDCSAVMYCNRRCREEDYNRSHRIECQIYFYSHSLGLPLTSSLRLAIQTMMILTKQGENLEKLMKDPHFKNPMKRASNLIPEKLDAQDCARHFRSLKNDTRLFAYPYDLFSLPEAALSLYRVIVISHILRQTSYFDSVVVKKAEADDGLMEERKYVGLLFLKLMISIPTYTLGIQELHQKEVSDIMLHTLGSALTSVGSGFYLFHALFNHSCYVNVALSQYKDTLVSEAAQPIKAGQQLFVSYGPNFLMDPQNQRREDLRQGYQFICSCQACEENWPIFIDIPNQCWSLPSCNITSVQWQYFLEEVEKFYTHPLSLFEYNINLYNFFRKYLTIFHRNFKKPVPQQLFIFLAFQTLLQSRGSNYVYIRDSVLMSL